MYKKLIISFLLCGTTIFCLPDVTLDIHAFTKFLLEQDKITSKSQQNLRIQAIDALLTGGDFDILSPEVRQETIVLFREFRGLLS